jgi:hypothetical protein
VSEFNADELRTAALLWTTYHDERPGSLEYRQAKQLAVAYLAEHPADDGETADQSWAESAGAKRHASGNCEWPAVVNGTPIGIRIDYTTESDPQLLIYQPSGEEGREPDLVIVPERIGGLTRGHVRRLCAVLGIPLSEAP